MTIRRTGLARTRPLGIKSVRACCLSLAWGLFSVHVAANIIQNGQFSEDGTGWSTEGPVEFGREFAELSDADNAIVVRLYQPAAFIGPGRLSLEFFDAVSDAVPVGLSPDTVFAVLDFTDDPASYDPESGGDVGSLNLFQVDRNGVVSFTGDVTAGTLGPGWQTYSADILSTNSYIVLLVQLIGANAIDDDSFVLVDNVRVRVDPRLLDPQLSSVLIDQAGNHPRLTFSDPRGWPEAFEIQATSDLLDPMSWESSPGQRITCPAPGQFEVDLPEEAFASQLRFFRVRVLGL